jgi:hypothetical protein
LFLQGASVVAVIGFIAFTGILYGVSLWEYRKAQSDFTAAAARGQEALVAVKSISLDSILDAESHHGENLAIPAPGVAWAPANGFYTRELRKEALLHAAELGSVLVLYDQPDAAAIRSLKLGAALLRWSRTGIVVAPQLSLDETILLETRDRQLRLDHFDPDAAAAFIDRFGNHPLETVPWFAW